MTNTNDTSKLEPIENLIIDLDGVLYRGNTPIRGAGEFIDFVRQGGIPFLLVTNNSTRTVEHYVAKLARMDIMVGEQEILTSAEATATYLGQIAPHGARIHAVGEDGVRLALESKGFVLNDGTDVAYVVVGMDRQFTYAKLAAAAIAIRAGAVFIGTNPDKTYPTEAGLMPGAGSLLAAIEAATDTAPLISGKPEATIFELALERLKAAPETTAVIGDRLETDILGGRRLGLVTILLMSGVTDAERLAASSLVPDLTYDDIGALYRAWCDGTSGQNMTKRHLGVTRAE